MILDRLTTLHPICIKMLKPRNKVLFLIFFIIIIRMMAYLNLQLWDSGSLFCFSYFMKASFKNFKNRVKREENVL